jgi:hypothetical protein
MLCLWEIDGAGVLCSALLMPIAKPSISNLITGEGGKLTRAAIASRRTSRSR